MKIYFNFRDWWIGYYKGNSHHYVCLLPTLVIRWDRKVAPKPIDYSQFFSNMIVTDSIPHDTAYLIPSGFDPDALRQMIINQKNFKTPYGEVDQKILLNPRALEEIKKVQSWKWKEPGA